MENVWRDVEVRELCTDIVDCINKTAPLAEHATPYKMIRTSNVRDGRVDTENVRYVEKHTFERWSRRLALKEGDVILTREAPLGDVGLLRDSTNIFLGQRLVMYRADPSVCDNRFLMYSMMGPIVQAELTRLGSGATVEHLRVPDCERFTIPCPPLFVQKRIGAVLGAIDDMIENNRRRVAILEQMAREIYTEWFVRYRFPGHESATFVDSPLGPIPSGWDAVNLNHVARIIRGRSYKSSELVDEGGLPFVNLKCMKRGGGFRRDGLKSYSGVYTDDQVVRCGDIVMGVTDLTQDRTIIAKSALVPSLPQEIGIISLDVVKVLPLQNADRLWCFAVLRWSDFSDHVKETASGATVLHLPIRELEQQPILLPDSNIREAFAEVLAPLLDAMSTLEDQVDVLSQIRDLLLPKLVTGQIDVSSL